MPRVLVPSACIEIRSGHGKNIDSCRHRPAVIDLESICLPLLVERKTSPLYDPAKRLLPLTARGINGSVCQSSVDSRAVHPIVSGKKNAATIQPGENICARDGKSTDRSIY